MKNYGTDTVTKETLRELADVHSFELDAVDKKQSKQIADLRRLLYLTAAVNLTISLVLLVKVFG